MTTVPARKSALAQRLKPAGAAGVGLLVLGLNVAMLIGVQRFYPFGTILGCALFCAGAFGMAVGEPEDPYGYRPMWFKVGLVAAALVGLLAGILMNVALASD
jgi:hypothetical protein